ncbi:hypothetical protein VCRA2121O157_90064 [Vibrio crassostreae]|nr:hypothetical protein VCRA2113O138_100054 [Vibrio crassostreae]CAK1698182.1 hypothetical protein VCRA2110O135_100061 [Vibrio crassostreae]CAK1698330.1 hypothetical protein VCRA2112O189_100061 [Vibrio crassostreae]CAK1727517.1 hypothetical protein VCRA2118O236_120061 [Vibrio crassostreae]CAK1731899.1 hypothetical protein VCRA2119O245_120064 [Vibrio crassostreae]
MIKHLYTVLTQSPSVLSCMRSVMAKIVLQKQKLNENYKNLSLNCFTIGHTFTQVINQFVSTRVSHK